MSLVVVTLITLLVSISAFGARIDAKPLSQYQVKFRRLPPKEFSAALGSSITIECEAGSSPPPTIHWLKNGIRIIQSEFNDNRLDDEQPTLAEAASRVALSSTRSRLFIDCASFDDEAVYTCVAENPFSRVATQTKLSLIKPLLPVGENELAEELASLGELQAAAAAAAAASKRDIDGLATPDNDAKSSLSAVSQCLTQKSRAHNQQEPVRIHMWTHNILEIENNNIILYCRSNVYFKPNTQATLNTFNSNHNNNNNNHLAHHHNNQQLKQHKTSSSQQDQEIDINSIAAEAQQQQQQATISWLLPNEKPVTSDQKDKFEILETGDLLIKDLSWADMGNYICTVSDEQSSDFVSTFVYPAKQH